MASLTIDFTDRDDIRAKLPAARERLTEMERALREQSQEVDDWRILVETLTRRAEVPIVPADKDVLEQEASNSVTYSQAGPVEPLDLVVEVIDREIRKIKSKDVADILRSEGHAVENVVISNALFYAAKRAKPPRVKTAEGRGYYAPLTYQEEAPASATPLPSIEDAEDREPL